MFCDRCLKLATGHTCSMFNSEEICLDCKKIEEQHPDYERARRVESERVRQGDYNFRGVGLPVGYAAWAATQREAAV